MKRVLFFVVMGFAAMQFANAQVIELIGQGVLGENPSTLIIPDNGPVEKVVVVAAAVFYGDDPAAPADVTFSDADETYTVSFIETDPNLAPPFILNDPTLAFGYYTATFTSVDVSGITLETYGQEAYVNSFTAYIYRSGDTPGIFSDVQGPHAYLYRLGSENPLEYSFTIPASVSARDVVVTLPFSHMHSSDLRPANVMVTAGDKFVEVEFEENNAGDLLHLEPITLEDVDGDVTEVAVTIYSQTLAETTDGDGGSSFITGPGLLTTTFEEEDLGCTLTQGYWKTHSEYGPAPYDENWTNLPLGADTEFFLSGQTYYQVLWSPPKGNPYYILAHQYIAAELNILAGASDAAVSSEMADAKALLETYTPAQVRASLRDLRPSFTSLAGTLDKYNNGEIGPGHCDDGEMEQEEDLQLMAVVTLDAQINPNPVRNNARIKFVPVVDGKATVDLFDLMGNKKASLFNQNVQKGIQVNIGLSVRGYKEGSYVVLITNGFVKESHKISIGK